MDVSIPTVVDRIILLLYLCTYSTCTVPLHTLCNLMYTCSLRVVCVCPSTICALIFVGLHLHRLQIYSIFADFIFTDAGNEST